MIVTLAEAKGHLKVEVDDDDAYITLLINAAEVFITDMTGKTFTDTDYLAKVACLLLITGLYLKRAVTIDKGKVSQVVLMIFTQLSLS